MSDLFEFINLLPHYLFDWSGCFLASRRERIRELLLGIPAVLLGIAIVYSARVSPVQSANLVQNLVQESVRALEHDDLERVNFLIGRIRKSGRIPSGLEYRLALKYQASGDADKAHRLMKSLAREMTPERPDALKWLAVRLLEGTPSTDDLKTAEDYLVGVIKQKPNDGQGHWLLAQVYIREGLLDDASKHLTLLAPFDYRASLLQADLCKKLGHEEQASQAVKQTLQLLDKLPADEQTRDSARARGECLFYLHRDEEAALTFEEAFKKYLDKSFKLPLYITYLRLSTNSDNSDAKLKILEKALELAPGNSLILAQISQLALEEPEKSRQAIGKLEEALQQGQSTAAMHFVLGTNASLTGKTSDAIEHLKQALESSSSTQTYGPPTAGALTVVETQRRKTAFTNCMIKNNLAWTLAHNEQPDLEQALQLADDVCLQFPDVHTFRETRGQIHAKLSHWQAAIEDLTFALTGMPKYAPLHTTLAEVYKATGNKFGALRHARLAEESQGSVR